MPIDRRDLRRRLFHLAAEQGGYFSAAQAKGLGYSYQAQAHHVASGNWLRIDRGLFRLSEWIPELHDDLIRWTLWSRGRAVVSHETALAFHGIGELESPKVHLTAPRGFSLRDDALILHIADLPAEDIIAYPGFRTTTLLRTLVDVASGAVDEDQLSRAVQQARDAGLLTVRQLRARAEAVDLRAALRIERVLQRADVA
jgi:predicted transcriptional regulator of viral defense system